ncbi:hypothetical protein GWK47_015327 [Chionoecetes opilio]|uniref:Uncharacterized protein n=1 Tax=Chionoecetes opilio TaxID=41210 RepID=A0A8J4XSI5_CHIOP|nr:hypothetical protein GWK47_015327 [Chionoecetes opilio]
MGHLASCLDQLCDLHAHTHTHAHLLAAAAHLDSQLPAPLQAAIGEAVLVLTEARQVTPSPAHVRLLLLLRARRLSASGSVVHSGVVEGGTDAGHLEGLTLLYGGCGGRAALLYPFLATASQLTALTCTDFCDNTMIDIVARTCPHLHTLDLRGCYDVTDEGMAMLCGLQEGLRASLEALSQGGVLRPCAPCCASLREIKLSMTKVTEAGVAVILLVLTHIHVLRVPDVRMEKLFSFLHSLEHKGVQCNLREFHSREILNELQLEVLVTLCPNLEYLQVSFTGTHDMDLARLQLLPRLRQLRRAKFADVNCDALAWFLVEAGARLTHLHLYTYHTKFSQRKLSISRRHLQQLAAHCPRLESLCLDGYLLGEDHDAATHRITHYFKALTCLQVASMKLSEEDLHVFLAHSCRLQVLELVLHNPHVLHDRLLCALLDAGVWRHLAKIRVLNSPLTSRALARLVAECPRLREVGCLHTWLVPKEHVAQFKHSVTTQNFDLEIY